MTFYLIALAFPLALLMTGLLAGKIIEANHLASLAVREERLRGVGISNLDATYLERGVEVVGYVDGQAVIAADRFKVFLSSFRKFFGGEMRSLGTVLARARREAVVRMLEQAEAHGADQVLNLRIETSTISRGEGRAQTSAMAEVHAYGTAVRSRRP